MDLSDWMAEMLMERGMMVEAAEQGTLLSSVLLSWDQTSLFVLRCQSRPSVTRFKSSFLSSHE
jgi:hypothetical protein